MFYRVWQNAEAMRKLGADVAVLWYQSNMFMSHPWEEDLDKDGYSQVRRDIEGACKMADVVVWMKLHTQQSLGLFAELKQKYEKPFLTEIDDYVFTIPQTNIASTVYGPGQPLTQMFVEQMKMSDGLICSTPCLAELYKRFNDDIMVVENSIDLSLWDFAAPRRKSHRVNIGWAGGGTHVEDLDIIKEPIFEVLNKYKNVHFTIWAGETPWGYPGWMKDHERIHRIYKAKTIKAYPKAFRKAGFDIGIAPLVDNNFNRGKSNLRWLEYSASGIPTVASDVMHFSQSIKHGFNGFLCESKEDWVNCLSNLVESDNLRQTIGLNAKNTVKAEWNPQKMGSKYLHYLKEKVYAFTNEINTGIKNRRPDRRSRQHALV